MSDAATIARALRGKPYGPGYLIPCPAVDHGAGRGDRRPSCTIRDGDEPGRILVHCFAGCLAAAILDGLRAAGLLANDAPSYAAHPHLNTREKEPRPEPEPDPRALRIWLAAQPIRGTIAETYLREHRKISCDLPPSLRFGAALHSTLRKTLPALVAAIARPTDRKIVAVQATFLTPDGAKVAFDPPRLTFGQMGTGAIRLAPCTDVLGIAEGCETALAVTELSTIPCWSSVGCKRLPNITLPDSVRELHIFGDNDEPGRREAAKAGETYARQGRKVYIRTPPPRFGDYNDALMARAGQVAA